MLGAGLDLAPQAVRSVRRSFALDPGNLFAFPDAVDNAAWSKGSSTVTANASAAPDGSTTADKVREVAADASHYVGIAGTAVADATVHTLIMYAKAGERSKLALAITAGAVGNAQFDLTTGTVTAGAPAFTSAAMIAAGGDWWRLSATFTTTGPSLTFQARLIQSGTGTFQSYLGDGTSGLFLWRSQLVPGA